MLIESVCLKFLRGIDDRLRWLRRSSPEAAMRKSTKAVGQELPRPLSCVLGGLFCKQAVPVSLPMFLKDHLAGSDADDPISFVIHSKQAHLFWGWARIIIA
jgi:hypothetical protein